MRSFLSASESEASQPACKHVTRILREILVSPYWRRCAAVTSMPRCRAIASCRFFVVELYAVWRLPAPAVAISEIVTASASMRYLVMVRLGASSGPDPYRDLGAALARADGDADRRPGVSMTTFFPCHSVIESDRAAQIWTRKAALSPLGAATPGRVR